MHQYEYQIYHWSSGRPPILHVLSHVLLHQKKFGARLYTHIWISWRLRQLMGQEAQSAFVTCHNISWSYRWTYANIYKSLWLQETLNCFDFFWYGNNTLTSDVITQVFKYVGNEAWLAGIDLETSLLEARKNLFKENKIFCSRSFCDMQKFFNLNAHGVWTDKR